MAHRGHVAEVVRPTRAGTPRFAPHLAEAFAIAFDLAALYGVGGDGGTGLFSEAFVDTSHAVTLGSATKQNGGIHADLVEAMSLLVNNGKR